MFYTHTLHSIAQNPRVPSIAIKHIGVILGSICLGEVNIAAQT